MTSSELRIHLNNTYGLGEWPRTYEVDAETYANCCQDVFDYLKENYLNTPLGYQISLGLNNGLMFKNVELVYKPTK